MSKEKNYWLIGLGVFGSLLLVGLFSMIFIAVKNPVEMDSSHMMPYRELDKNYNDIMQSQKKFDESYVVEASKLSILKDSSTNLELNISSKSGGAVDANITALITRPDTSKHDIKITEFIKTKNSFISKPFTLSLEGRWKVIYKIEVGGTQKFVEFETFANKAAK